MVAGSGPPHIRRRRSSAIVSEAFGPSVRARRAITAPPTETALTVTLLSDPPPGTATTGHPVARTPTRRTATGARRARSDLLRDVTAAIGSLGVDRAASIAVRQHIDRMLREALERAGEDGDGGVPAVPAVRVACAHLAADDLEDTYLALLTARDLL